MADVDFGDDDLDVSEEALGSAISDLMASRNRTTRPIARWLLVSIRHHPDDEWVKKAIVAAAGQDRLLSQLMRRFPSKEPAMKVTDRRASAKEE
jgi:hypothetical protein